MKTLLHITGLIITLTSIPLVVLFQDGQEVMIESEESKTIEGNSVFNKIKFIPGLKRDIWMMNQSHHGPDAGSDNWDRLVIIVEKYETPKKVKFYQIKSGKLNWSESLVQEQISNKVACFMCHSNGPRAIRPNYNSNTVSYSLSSKVKVALWNMRIKTYGKTQLHEEHSQKDQFLKVPVKYTGHYENQKLEITSCTKCHSEDGIFARGYLSRQNAITVKFMIENKYMPPPGFTITNEDKLKLNKFIKGF